MVPFKSGCCIKASILSHSYIVSRFNIWDGLSKKTRMHFRKLNNSDSCFSRSQRHLRLFAPPVWREALVQSLATERNVLQWDIKRGSRREVFDTIANKPLNQRKQKWNQKGSECFWEIYHGSSKTPAWRRRKKKVTWKNITRSCDLCSSNACQERNAKLIRGDIAHSTEGPRHWFQFCLSINCLVLEGPINSVGRYLGKRQRRTLLI